MTTTIPATNVYRGKVAQAAAAGGPLPAAAQIAFGTGTTLPDVDDTALESEVFRNDLETASATDTVLTCGGSLSGADSGAPITEVGIFDDDGDLMGRRTFLPKTLETESTLLFTLNFQF
jgi:hypothetical protein